MPHRVEAGTPHARYALVERGAVGWRAQLCAVPYDWAPMQRLAQRNRTEFYRLLQKHALTPGNFKADSPESDDVADERHD